MWQQIIVFESLEVYVYDCPRLGAFVRVGAWDDRPHGRRHSSCRSVGWRLRSIHVSSIARGALIGSSTGAKVLANSVYDRVASAISQHADIMLFVGHRARFI